MEGATGTMVFPSELRCRNQAARARPGSANHVRLAAASFPIERDPPVLQHPAPAWFHLAGGSAVERDLRVEDVLLDLRQQHEPLKRTFGARAGRAVAGLPARHDP